MQPYRRQYRLALFTSVLAWSNRKQLLQISLGIANVLGHLPLPVAVTHNGGAASADSHNDSMDVTTT